MKSSRMSNAVVQEILRRSEGQEDAATIARTLSLNRMQVVAILSHYRMHAKHQHPLPDSQPPAETDLTITGPTISLPPGTSPGMEGEDDALRGIFVGEEADSDLPVMWDPANSRRIQNPHMMIMGESGSGKTYAQQCLVAELAHAGLPSIVFDYGQSFERDTLDRTFLKYCDPREHLIGEEGLTLNPLEIFERDAKGPNSVATRLADVFDAAFHLGDIQKKVLIDALVRAYEAAGITPDKSASWSQPPPTISDLRVAIDSLAADKHYGQYKNAAGLSARLTTFFMLVSFRTDQAAWSWEELISTDATRRVNVLQFRGLEGKTQRVLVELLLWHFFFHLKTQGQQPLRVFCVLDEAHHLSFREAGPLTAILREARKFGLGIIFASQQPEDFNPVAYGNTASKLVFQTADPTLKVSKFLASKSLNYDRPEEIRDIISCLQQGDALFVTGNHASVIHVSDFAKRSTLWSR